MNILSLLAAGVNLLFLQLVVADVLLQAPDMGNAYISYNQPLNVSVEWSESSLKPLLSEMRNFTFALCTGPNENIKSVQQLAKGVKPDELKDGSNNKFIATIKNTTKLEDGAYYIQVVSVGDKFYTIHYTNRFSISRSNDTEPDMDALSAVSPQALTMFLDKTSSKLPEIKPEYFKTPYMLQTGTIKYAPMQEIPSRTVTERWAPRTSLTSKWRGPKYTKIGGYGGGKKHTPVVAYTITQPATYSLRTIRNTLPPAPGPTTYYDPSQKLKTPTKASKKTHTKTQS
ncbi:uncharacterized protein RJT20DRAFT_130740 [Scheffersomyces xylosifermentans]|uniref:uncharacterized protein n=1 Tax=Scheffersomyces xylosifermentans TaxID=1304137 RepID=UPI00315C4F0C